MNIQKTHEHTPTANQQEVYGNPIRTGVIISAVVLLILAAIGYCVLEIRSSYFEYTNEDVKMLGDLMYAEVLSYEEVGISFDGETDEDVKTVYMLIGSTALHRLESRMWGETMKEVIYAPGQYYTALRGDLVGNIDTPKEVYKWAEELLKKGPWGPEGLIYEAAFKMGNVTYWKIDGKIYFGVLSNITKQVEGGKVN